MGLADIRIKMVEKAKYEITICLAIFVIALTLRVVYLQELKANPLFYHPQVDSHTYVNMARQMANGEFLRANKFSFYQPPLYPLVLAAFFKVVTGDLFLIHLGQFVLGALSCVLVYALGRACLGKKIALFAGILACIYWPFIYFEGELLAPALAIFLILSFLNIVIRYFDHKKWPYLATAGVTLGLSALTTPNILLFGWTVCPIFILLCHSKECSSAEKRNLRGIVLAMLLFLCTSFAVIAPVTVYNWYAEKTFILISHNDGLNFYIGNSPKEEEALAIRPGEEWNNFIRTPQRENPQTRLSSAKFSRYWYKKSLRYLWQQPVEFFKNQGKKVLQFLDAYEVKRNVDIYFFKDRFSKLMRLPLLGFGIVAPFALIGMIDIGKASIKMRFLQTFVLAYSISVILFFVASRYRLPIMPVLMLFAASGLFTFIDRFKTRQIPWQGFLLLIFAFLFINVDPLSVRPNARQVSTSEAESWYYIGRAQGDAAQAKTDFSERAVQYIKAIETMRMAGAKDTSFAYPHIFMGIYRANIGKDLLQSIESDDYADGEEQVLARQAMQNFQAAEQDYRTAHQVGPELLSPLYNLCLSMYYLNILDFNYSDIDLDGIREAISQRCDEIDRLADILLQKGEPEDKEKYSDIKFKASMQKQAALSAAKTI